MHGYRPFALSKCGECVLHPRHSLFVISCCEDLPHLVHTGVLRLPEALRSRSPHWWIWQLPLRAWMSTSQHHIEDLPSDSVVFDGTSSQYGSYLRWCLCVQSADQIRDQALHSGGSLSAVSLIQQSPLARRWCRLCQRRPSDQRQTCRGSLSLTALVTVIVQHVSSAAPIALTSHSPDNRPWQAWFSHGEVVSSLSDVLTSVRSKLLSHTQESSKFDPLPEPLVLGVVLALVELLDQRYRGFVCTLVWFVHDSFSVKLVCDRFLGRRPSQVLVRVTGSSVLLLPCDRTTSSAAMS